MDKVDQIYLINLDRRTDRWEQCKHELERVGIPLERVHRMSAVQHTVGAIGCSLSHVAVMCHAISNKFKNVMVLEDDCHFVQPLSKIEEAIEIATQRPGFFIHHDPFFDHGRVQVFAARL